MQVSRRGEIPVVDSKCRYSEEEKWKMANVHRLYRLEQMLPQR
jgi:hypothetical protein